MSRVYDEWREDTIAEIRELHRAGKLEASLGQFGRFNNMAREYGIRDACVTIGKPIDIQRCIDDPNYK